MRADKVEVSHRFRNGIEMILTLERVAGLKMATHEEKAAIIDWGSLSFTVDHHSEGDSATERAKRVM